MLRRTSRFFNTVFKLPQPKDLSSDPILMEESGAVLDDILRSIYPPVILPTISSVNHALALFRAVQKLDISHTPLSDVITQYIGNIEPPIRAWALAVDLGHVKARKMAVKRFIHHDGKIFGHHRLDELSRVDARSLLKLGWLREYVIEKASTMGFTITPCTAHKIGFDQIRAIAAADSLVPTEEVLQFFVRGARCHHCLSGLQSESLIAARRRVRVSVEELLERATDVENGTLPMNCKHSANVC
jgi:hypothetical protein